MSQVNMASPLTHCSVMMVSQLQTISEHALCTFSEGLPVLWRVRRNFTGESTSSKVEWDYDVMALKLINASHDRLIVGQLSNTTHESFMDKVVP
jgi:hypothetical protein